MRKTPRQQRSRVAQLFGSFEVRLEPVNDRPEGRSKGKGQSPRTLNASFGSEEFRSQPRDSRVGDHHRRLDDWDHFAERHTAPLALRQDSQFRLRKGRPLAIHHRLLSIDAQARKTLRRVKHFS